MSSSVLCNRIHIARKRLPCTGRQLWNEPLAMARPFSCAKIILYISGQRFDYWKVNGNVWYRHLLIYGKFTKATYGNCGRSHLHDFFGSQRRVSDWNALNKVWQVISWFALVHFATKTSRSSRLLMKGPRLFRLTVDCGVPTIIKDYCSWWLNGKQPAKRRESKIWLIIVHPLLDTFIPSELPAWKSDMAKVEMESREKCDRNGEHHSIQLYKCTNINKQEYDQTRISNQFCSTNKMLFLWLINHAVQTFHGLWIYSWLSEQTSVRITYFLQIPRCTFNILEEFTFQQVIMTCTCVAKLPNKKIWL